MQQDTLLLKKGYTEKMTNITHKGYETADNLSLTSQNCFARSTAASTRQPNPSCPSLSLPWEKSLSISPKACCDQAWWSTFPALLMRRSDLPKRRQMGREKGVDINKPLWNPAALAETSVGLQKCEEPVTHQRLSTELG